MLTTLHVYEVSRKTHEGQHSPLVTSSLLSESSYEEISVDEDSTSVWV